MRKILVAIGLIIGLCSIASADIFVNTCVYKSSYTATSETGTISNATYLKSVIISSPTAGGTIHLFDTSGSTTTGRIGMIGTDAIQEVDYSINVANGLTYKTETVTNGVTFIYRK